MTMKTAAGIRDLLASLVAYPRAAHMQSLEECMRALERDHPRAARQLLPFLEMARTMSLEELEELYTLTFDINPFCCLEVGWQLFGEEYARGAFMVEMRQMLQDCGVPESAELPDHLGLALALLERLPQDRASRLACRSVLPAVEKMIRGLAGKKNPFEDVLKAIATVLQERYATQAQGE